MRKYVLAFVLVITVPLLGGAQVSTNSPAIHLLRVAKSLVDSDRLDNPRVVESLLRIPIVRSAHNQGWWHNSCPAGGFNFEDDYVVAANGWFRTLSTGVKNMKSMPPVVGDIAMPPYPGSPGPFPDYLIGPPDLQYKLGVDHECVGPGYGLISVGIDFTNIPSFACISKTQIESIFPKLTTYFYTLPLNGTFQIYVSNGSYKQVGGLSPSRYVDRSKPFSVLQFVMTQAEGKGAENQPVCLLEMHINTTYKFSQLHNLAGQTPY